MDAKYLLATKDKQLGTCLRMLYAKDIQLVVKPVLNDCGKIEFRISISSDDEVFSELE